MPFFNFCIRWRSFILFKAWYNCHTQYCVQYCTILAYNTVLSFFSLLLFGRLPSPLPSFSYAYSMPSYLLCVSY